MIGLKDWNIDQSLI